MFVTVTDEAKAKIDTLVKQGGDKVILDLDDGAGKFSNAGSCDIGTTFRIFVADDQSDLSDYQATVDSTIGPLLAKKTSEQYMDVKMTLDYNPKYHALELKSPTSGLITPIVQLKSIVKGELVK